MDSTSYTVDRRDIRFVQKELLRVDELTRHPGFREFSPEDFDLLLNEGTTLVEEVFAPLNKPGDEAGSHLEDGRVRTPPGFAEAWRQAAEAGWIGVISDPEWGGQGVPYSVAIGVLESFYGANPSLYITAMLTGGAAGLITRFGDDWQKRTFATRMIAGEWGGTMCLSEPDAGSAVGDITTRAEPTADGHYKLRGTKCWISGGDHDMTENIVHLVLARTPDAPPGTKGISLFVVPRYRPDADGNATVFNDVHTVRVEHKLGIKASPTCVLEFGGNDDCHAWLLEAENRGMAQMFTLMNEARWVVGYQGLGAAAGAYRNALAYARGRTQGTGIEHGKDPNAPRTPIVNHPDVRHMLMTMKAQVEGARGLLYALGYYLDMAHGGPEEQRAYYQDLADLLTPVAKNHGADQGFEAVRLGIQVLGGVGFTEEYPLAQHLRDTKIASIYEGTSGIQALDLVTRKLAQRGGELYSALQEEIGGLRPELAQGASLQAAIGEWRGAVDDLTATVTALQQIAQQHGPREAVLNATGLTAYFGDVMGAYYLLRSALIAEEKLGGPAEGNGARLAEIRDSEELTFYYNKIKTAEHHVWHLLPRSRSVVQAVASRNFAALEALLE